jgi:APA family basic amino acid/polyamine antiporter
MEGPALNLGTGDGAKRELPRVLGPVAALSVIVGSVIGSGIFVVPARVAENVPAIGPIAALWILGGVFSLAGALTLAEMGAMIPQAGGCYVYLREAYGRLPAFLFGWTEFLVIRAGSVATLAAACALYFSRMVPAPNGLDSRLWQTIIAVAAITLVAIVNVLGTKRGGQVQVLGTAIKVGGLGAMMVLPFILGQAHASNLSPIWRATYDRSFLSGAIVAMVGILWAYDGWVNTSSLAEEIKDPGRNVPRAMAGGMAILISVYVGMTLVYHTVLTMPEIATAATEKGSPNAVAAQFCSKLLRPFGFAALGNQLISWLVVCSTLISLNGNALSGPRAYFAMARDGLFPARLCRIHPKFQTPANAVIAQSVWSILLTVAGTFFLMSSPPTSSTVPGPIRSLWTKLHETPLYDVMYSYVIFGGMVIYTLTITSVFVLRKRRPDAVRPYKTWGYPVTPLVYIAAALFLMQGMLVEKSGESIAGLGIILLGVPAYYLFETATKSPAER